MSNRQLFLLTLLTISADNLGELVGGMVAKWPRPAEVERAERHRQFLAEVRAKLEETR